MGLDADNIKKRLSQLELDVKQMNQMIDDNIHIDDEEDASRDSQEEDSQNDESEHEQGSGNEETIRSVDDVDDADDSREYHETEESNQGYLQDEILEAIDNTQQSFVQNAVGDQDINGENDNGDNEVEEQSHDKRGSTELEEPRDIEKPQSEITQVPQAEYNAKEQLEPTHDAMITEEQQSILESKVDASPIGDEEGHEGAEQETQSELFPEPEPQTHESEFEKDESKQGSVEVSLPQEDIADKVDIFETSDEPILSQDVHEKVGSESEEVVEAHTTSEEILIPGPIEVSVPVVEEESTDTPDHNEDIQLHTENDNKDEWEEFTEEEEDEQEQEVKREAPRVESNAMRQESTVKYDLAAGEDKIILPKHNTSTMAPSNNIVPSTITVDSPAEPQAQPRSNSTTPVEKRKSTNPFRVISVSSPSSATNSRVSSAGSNRSTVSSGSNGNNSGHNTETSSKLGESLATLQARQEYLISKCNKLEKEIKYLRQMESEGSLTLGDGKKLNRAINKLQEYLDRKTKERYEVGVLLSRQLRRQINRGENGEFWIGRK